MVDSNTPHWIK
jgi:hypothetical protein